MPHNNLQLALSFYEKVRIGSDEEKAQSDKDFNFKNRGGEKTK